MPSIDGGSSSGRDYAPHMWVLNVGGNPNLDEDHSFVGNAETSYRPDGFYGRRYHIGVTALGEIVCDYMDAPADYKEYTVTRIGIEPSEIPEEARMALLTQGLRQIGTMEGNSILGALGIDMPAGISAINFGLLFNGTPEEKETELAKRKAADEFARNLSEQLGLE